MSTYYCNFANQTEQTWTMGVYQTLPSTPGLDSVSWQQTTVPQSGLSGVSWNVTYNVVLGDYQQAGGIGVYTSSQTLGTLLGTAWNIVFKDDVQQLAPVGGAAQPNEIVIYNQSGRLANPGIGMSGQGSVFQQGVVGGAAAQFTVTPSYWVALFNQVEIGEVISTNVSVGPLELQYPSGFNSATLTASLNGENIELNVTYSNQFSANAAAVQQRIKSLARLRKAA